MDWQLPGVPDLPKSKPVSRNSSRMSQRIKIPACSDPFTNSGHVIDSGTTNNDELPTSDNEDSMISHFVAGLLDETMDSLREEAMMSAQADNAL